MTGVVGTVKEDLMSSTSHTKDIKTYCWWKNWIPRRKIIFVRTQGAVSKWSNSTTTRVPIILGNGGGLAVTVLRNIRYWHGWLLQPVIHSLTYSTRFGQRAQQVWFLSRLPTNYIYLGSSDNGYNIMNTAHKANLQRFLLKWLSY